MMQPSAQIAQITLDTRRAHDPDQSGIERCAITEPTATQLESVTRVSGLLTNIDHNADVTYLLPFFKTPSHMTCRPRLPTTDITIAPV